MGVRQTRCGVDCFAVGSDLLICRYLQLPAPLHSSGSHHTEARLPGKGGFSPWGSQDIRSLTYPPSRALWGETPAGPDSAPGGRPMRQLHLHRRDDLEWEQDQIQIQVDILQNLGDVGTPILLDQVGSAPGTRPLGGFRYCPPMICCVTCCSKLVMLRKPWLPTKRSCLARQEVSLALQALPNQRQDSAD